MSDPGITGQDRDKRPDRPIFPLIGLGIVASAFLFFGLGIFFCLSLYMTKDPGAVAIANASSWIGVIFGTLGILVMLRIRRPRA